MFVRRLLSTTLPLILVLASTVVRPVAAQDTLAETMNRIANSVNWADSDYRVQHTGVIFSKITSPHYSPEIDGWSAGTGTILGARLMQLDGLGLPDVSSVLSQYSQTGPLPNTYVGWGVYQRYPYHLYDWAVGTSYASKWNKTAALEVMRWLVQGLNNMGLNYVADARQELSGGGRYYDEHAEGFDIFLGLGDTEYATKIWVWMYADHWNGLFWGYDGTSGIECEMGPFAILAAKLYIASGRTLPYFDTVVKDLTYKLLSPAQAWKDGIITHIFGRSWGERLDNTMIAWAALQMYVNMFDSTSRQKMINMLTGKDGVPAWQHLMQSTLYAGNNKFYFAPQDNAGEVASYRASCVALKLLFLNGIVPDGGSLAIPAIEEMYQDTEMMMPATHFRFNYAAKSITIPVNPGNLRFIFGTSETPPTSFPSTGIYTVQFSNDWNSVTSVTKVSELYADLPYLEVSSPTRIPSDLNNDYKVGLQDLVILAEAYGSKPGDPNWNNTADIDGNLVVGLSDLVQLAQHYGQQHP